MSLYGPMVTIEDVRLALTGHLKTWTPAYIAEVGRQRDVTMVPFRGYTTETGDTFPICLTACAGVEGTTLHGDGRFTASFPTGAAAVVSAATREEATALAGYYGTAIRAAVLQHPSLSGFAAGTDWAGETVQEVAWDTGKAIVACTVRFTVHVDAVLDRKSGPATPPVDVALDPGDFADVDATVITITRS